MGSSQGHPGSHVTRPQAREHPALPAAGGPAWNRPPRTSRGTLDLRPPNCRRMTLLGFLVAVLFFSFLAALQHREFPGQGSDLNPGCNLSHSCRNARSLTHCARPEANLHPSAPKMLPIPPHHSRKPDSVVLSHLARVIRQGSPRTRTQRPGEGAEGTNRAREPLYYIPQQNHRATAPPGRKQDNVLTRASPGDQLGNRQQYLRPSQARKHSCAFFFFFFF